MTDTRPLLPRFLTGIGLAVLGLALGFLLAGLGHGWVSSLFFSILLLAAWPAVLLRDIAPARKWLSLDLAIVAMAAAADIALVLYTMREVESAGWRILYFPGDPVRFVVTAAWLLLWLGWQYLALRCVLRDLRQAG